LIHEKEKSNATDNTCASPSVPHSNQAQTGTQNRNPLSTQTQAQRTRAMMQIDFKTSEQRQIADLLWKCKSQQEVNLVIRMFGIQAQIVKEMMIATSLDDIEDVREAQQLINKIAK
jgi:hypothetical protein